MTRSERTSQRAVYKCQVEGLKELKLTFRDIATTFDKSKDGKALKGTLRVATLAIGKAYEDAARFVRDTARSNAAGKRAPRRLYSGTRPAIFSIWDPDVTANEKKRGSALVGARTGLSRHTPDPHLYVNWNPSSGRRKKDNSRIGHGGLSISFAGLFERGTANRRIKPTRFFRSAIYSTKSAVVSILTRAYRSAIELANKYQA